MKTLRRCITTLALLAGSIGAAGQTLASSTGILGYTARDQLAAGCGAAGGCHGATKGGSVTVSGPVSVLAGQTYSYTVTMSGISAGTATAGFNGAVTRTNLATTQPLFQAGTGLLVGDSSTQVSHSAAKTPSSGTASWTVNLAFPAAAPVGTSYTVFATANAGHNADQFGWNHAANLSVTVASALPANPFGLSASPLSTSAIDLAWGGSSPEFRLLRKIGSYPTDPNDASATVLVNGASATKKFSDTGLTPGTAYYYRVWGKSTGANTFSTTPSEANASTFAPAVTRHVSVGFGNDNAGANTCTDVANPCKTITRAMAAAGPGDTVSVGQGTYNVATGEVFPISLKNGVQLVATGTAAATIIDGAGDTVKQGLILSEANTASTARIERFTFRNGVFQGAFGNPVGGGALRLSSATGTVTVARNVFEQNQAIGFNAATSLNATGTGIWGGAIYGFSSAVSIQNNVFRSNTARAGNGFSTPGSAFNVNAYGGTGEGGAIYISGSGAIVNNTFHGNAAIGGNGGAGVDGSANRGIGSGGAITVNGIELKNNMFTSNSASVGQGAAAGGTSTAGAVAGGPSSSATNLLNGNTVDGAASTGDATLTGTITALPSYHSAPGDLRIRNSSAARAAGTASGAPTVDHLGATRPTPPSIGAYEASLLSQAITFNPVVGIVTGGSAAVSVTGGGSGNPVTLSSLTSGTCTVVGTTATGRSAGTCSIAGNQAASADYAAAPETTISFLVGSAPTSSITLTKAGTGTGTVTSSLAALIDCGTACASASGDFARNTTVTLTATPPNESIFAGWSGACSGTGACVINVGESAIAVTATFTLIVPGAPIPARTNVPLGALVESQAYIHGGASASVSVSGGLLSLGCTGTYSAGPVNIVSGQRLCVAHVTPLALGAETRSPLTFTPSSAGPTTAFVSTTTTTLGNTMPASLVAGSSHNLFLTRSRQVWGWGDNTAGKLGDGTTATSAIPVRASALDQAIAVAAGMAHSLAVKADGTVWAWGLNDKGQVGVNPTTTATCVVPGANNESCLVRPTQVSGLGRVIGVSGGWRHSLALQSDGSVWAWGSNFYGEAGGALTSNPSHIPIKVSLPVPAIRVAAGYMHSVALGIDGRVYVWGRGNEGERGPANPTLAGPTVDEVTGIDTVTDIAASGAYVLARRAGGSLWAWGGNVYGTLGDATVPTLRGVGLTGFRAAPAVVPGMESNVAEFAAGYGFVLARKTDGTLWGWGLNNRGQMGKPEGGPDVCGRATDPPTNRCYRNATALTGYGTPSRIAAGGAHALVVRADGSIVAFGDNARGQRGTREPNFGDNYNQLLYDPDFTLIPGGTFGSPGGVGRRSGSGSLNIETLDQGLAFPDQALNTTSVALPVTVVNLSTTANITITSVAAAGSDRPADFSVSSNTCSGATLTPSQSCDVNLLFSPASLGDRNGSLTINSDATDSAQVTYALYGKSIDPRVSSEVALTASASQSAAGTAVTFTATVTAAGQTPSGTVAFKANGSLITGCGARTVTSGVSTCETSGLPIGANLLSAEYSGDGNVKPSTSPDLTHTVVAPTFAITATANPANGGTVSCTPNPVPQGGSSACTATAASGFSFGNWSGDCTGTTTCTLSNVASVKSVMANFIASASGVDVAPLTLAFGNQAVGSTSAARTVTLTNSGSGTLTLTSASSNNGQYLVTQSCTPLAGGASCPVSVRFTPTALGVRSGTLTIATSSGSRTVELSGSGVASQSFNANASAVVTGYYETILGRSPDAGGLNFWTGEAARVSQLGADVREVFYAMSISFFSSPEYVNRATSNEQYIRDLYRTFFIRDPDAAGLAFWVSELVRVQSRSALLNSFLFSAEFSGAMTALFGSPTIRPEVNLTMDLFRGVVGRLPDNDGYNFWLGQVRTAQCAGGNAVNAKVTELANLFFGAAEYAQRNRNDRDFMGDVYNTYLRRGPGGDAGFDYWAGEVPIRGRDGVRAEFVPSAEFQTRVAAIVAAGCFASP